MEVVSGHCGEQTEEEEGGVSKTRKSYQGPFSLVLYLEVEVAQEPVLEKGIFNVASSIQLLCNNI